MVCKLLSGVAMMVSAEEATKKFVAKNSCKSDPTPDQDWKVKNPMFYGVKPSCEFDEHEEVYAQVCNHCKSLHQPCAGEFAMCHGCDENNIVGHTHTEKISCQSLEAFVTAENSCKVQLQETDLKADATDMDVIMDATNEKVLPDEVKNLTGIEISNECEAQTRSHNWTLIPARFEYSCEQCGSKGSTGLLVRCCNVCLAFHAALENGGMFKPFTTCVGCDVDTIENDAVAEPIPFKKKKDYADHTAEAAAEALREYIQSMNIDAWGNTQQKCTDTSARRLDVNDNDEQRCCADHMESIGVEAACGYSKNGYSHLEYRSGSGGKGEQGMVISQAMVTQLSFVGILASWFTLA